MGSSGTISDSLQTGTIITDVYRGIEAYIQNNLISLTVIGTWTSNTDPVVHRTGTMFTWNLPDLAWTEWGVITLTAQVDTSLVGPTQTPLANTVEIYTSSIEQYHIPERLNTDMAILTVSSRVLYLPLILRNY